MDRPNRITLTDVGLLLIRVMPAIVFMFHGSQKLFGAFGGPGMEGFTSGLEKMGVPMPGANAYLAACAEFFGGVALLLGAGTRIAVVPLVVTMLVASFVAHGGAFSLANHGMEYALTLAVVTAGLGLTGAGRLSVDGLLGSLSEPKNSTDLSA